MRVRTLAVSAAVLVTAASCTTAAQATHVESKPVICHPVNGRGETGTGWTLIRPDKASSHIRNGAPKHRSKDGRVDVYAQGGRCPVVVIPDDPEPTQPPATEPPTDEPSTPPATQTPDPEPSTTPDPEPETTTPSTPAETGTPTEQPTQPPSYEVELPDLPTWYPTDQPTEPHPEVEAEAGPLYDPADQDRLHGGNLAGHQGIGTTVELRTRYIEHCLTTIVIREQRTDHGPWIEVDRQTRHHATTCASEVAPGVPTIVSEGM